jgi:hypothetical protein
MWMIWIGKNMLESLEHIGSELTVLFPVHPFIREQDSEWPILVSRTGETGYNLCRS